MNTTFDWRIIFHPRKKNIWENVWEREKLNGKMKFSRRKYVNRFYLKTGERINVFDLKHIFGSLS